MNYVDGGNTLG